MRVALIALFLISPLGAKPIVPSSGIQPDTKATWASFTVDGSRKFEWTIFVRDLIDRPKTLWSPDDPQPFVVDFTALRKRADQVMSETFGALDQWPWVSVNMLSWGDSNGNYYYALKFEYLQRKMDVEVEPGVKMTYENKVTIPVFFDGHVVPPTEIKTEGQGPGSTGQAR